ncbi:IPO5 [Cordylochernes scorpioides]|uniref:IPO5 n=1 Tax=Cordylochernes scorpioides TaxID=51811 RepID=A0ABY6KFE8_9ARAC|nr:IPO5 [Cordylochernes scorpioides]
MKIAVPTRLSHLVAAVSNTAASQDVRQLAAVLLRRLIIAEFEECISKLPLEQQVQLRTQVLALVQSSQDHVLKMRLADVAAELARNYLDDDGNNLWPEFLEFLFQHAKSPEPLQKAASLQMFALTFPKYQFWFWEGWCEQVKVSAVKATAAFLVAHEKEHALHRNFAECLPLLLAVLQQSLEKASNLSVLKAFVDLAESCPKYLRPQLDNLLPLITRAIGDKDLDDEWRQLSLELFVTLSENAPAMMRKQANKHIGPLIPHIFAMMMELEDSPEWARQDSEPLGDEDDMAVFGESSLDRIACALGGRIMLPLVTPSLQQLLGAEGEWQARHAALMALSAIGEGCHKQMEPLMPTVVETVLPFLLNPHPRVRHAACNALGQMATDFAPSFEKKFHSKVIPGLVSLLDDTEHPRVQAHAAAALVNFFEECSRGLLLPYLPGVASKLEVVLSARYQSLNLNGHNLVLEQIMVTLSSLAEVMADAFAPYYSKFMPCLKFLIEKTSGAQELRLLRGKAIECASLLGLSVGREHFMADASAIMDLLLRSQTNEELAPDDPQLSYLISSWARICKILGKQFEPYLPYVMGPVLKAAELKPEIALLDSEDVKDIDEDDDWQFVSLGDAQNFGIRTAGLEEKATACRMLVCYARELKEGFVNYLEEVVRLMVPLLKFYFHDGVREAAAESFPHLLECAKSRGAQYVGEMWGYICPELLRAIEAEPEQDVLTEYFASLIQCIEKLGKNFITEDMINQILHILDKHLKNHFSRAAERQEKRKDEDYDDVVEESLLDENEEDVYLLSKVTEVLRVLFSCFKHDFFPYFDTLLPQIVQLLSPERPWTDHQWGLCVFDDVIEHGGPLCKKYEEFFLKPMLQGLRHQTEEVRQAAAYGVGVLGQFGGNEFAQTCAEAIPLLAEMVAAPGSRNDGAINATENAISAVAKILVYNSSQVRVDELLPVWVSWLPVYEDTEEVLFIYDFLCSLMEQNNPLVLGPDHSRLPHVVAAMAETMVRNAEVLPTKICCFPPVDTVEKARSADNREIAMKRLEQMTKKLISSNLYDDYDDIFRVWLADGIIEKVPAEQDDAEAFYLPHCPVQGLKIPSLNDCHEKGPNLIEMIPNLMLRFRNGKFGVMEDIKKVLLQIESQDANKIEIHMMVAKSRVVPLKRPTISRLELLAGVVGAQLNKMIAEALEMKNVTNVFWSDATTALAWIKHDDQWGTFVRNRIKEICRLGDPGDMFLRQLHPLLQPARRDPERHDLPGPDHESSTAPNKPSEHHIPAFVFVSSIS